MPADLEAELEFSVPDMTAPLDVAAHRALAAPPCSVKGMFFQALFEALPTGMPEGKRYVSFRAYPMLEYMDLLLDAAKTLHPRRPIREGLRRVGHLGYPTFANSLIGRVIMGVLGNDLDAIVGRAPRAYAVSIEPGRVTSQRVAEQHWRMAFTKVPNFIDCYQLGVVEGAILHCGARPRIEVCTQAIDSAVLDVRWT